MDLAWVQIWPDLKLSQNLLTSCIVQAYPETWIYSSNSIITSGSITLPLQTIKRLQHISLDNFISELCLYSFSCQNHHNDDGKKKHHNGKWKKNNGKKLKIINDY